MTRLPEALHRRIERDLGAPVTVGSSVGGGSINQACRVESGGRAYFLKFNRAPLPALFAREAQGLVTLRAATDRLVVPEPILWDEPFEGAPGFLLMEWLPSARPDAHFPERLGEALASLHRVQAEHYGLDDDNYIGSLPQPNEWTASWVEFYGVHRLGAQLAIGRRSGALPTVVIRAVERAIDRLGERIGHGPPPSLLHGDMWGGNHAALEDGRPAIYDPAVYYGDRETEIAFTRLFGGLGGRFYEAYDTHYPLPADAAERVDLYNLYPLLVHANLFGGHYISQVRSIAERYG